MAKKNERTVLFLDLHVKTKTRTPNISGLPMRFSISDLMEKVVALREANSVNAIRGKGENKKEIYLADIEQDTKKKCWHLLINITDTTLADEVHRKIGGNEDTRKVNTKDDGVGTDFSSHLVIKSNPQADGSWIVLYEQSPSLSIKLIASYLNELFGRVAKANEADFKTEHPKHVVDKKGNVKEINTYCHCHFNGHISDQFKDDLNNGSFKDVKLITGDFTRVVGYDSQKHTNIKEIEVPVTVDRKAIAKAGGNLKWIDHLRTNEAIDLGMQEIKVSFKDEGNVSHTAEIDAHTGHLINSEKYVKKVKIEGFTEVLTTSVDVIHKPIMNKMLEHL